MLCVTLLPPQFNTPIVTPLACFVPYRPPSWIHPCAPTRHIYSIVDFGSEIILILFKHRLISGTCSLIILNVYLWQNLGAAAQTTFGSGYGSYSSIKNLYTCTGNETRLQYCSGIRSFFCGGAAGVQCTFETGNPHFVVIVCTTLNNTIITDCSNGDIRLVNSDSILEGRVEICYDRVWGTVCSRGWEVQDAGIACKQLGFSSSGQKLLCYSAMSIATSLI